MTQATQMIRKNNLALAQALQVNEFMQNLAAPGPFPFIPYPPSPRTNGKYILDKNKNSVEEHDLYAWARWFEKADRKVAYTSLGKYFISTIFLGIDHLFGRGKPSLYETMVFEAYAEHGLPQERSVETLAGRYLTSRYSNKIQAAEGHYLTVEYIKDYEKL